MKPSKRERRLDLNPSSADRWTTCTASPKFIYDNWDKIPPDSSTLFSKQGTTAHEVAAALLENRKPRTDDAYCCPTPIDADMHRHAWAYMEYVEDLRAKNGLLLVEQKMGLWYMPGRNAIVDAAVSNPDSLHVIDYKYGEGVAIHPENNLQAAIYAKSIGTGLNLPADFPVDIHIYQPRGRNADDSPSHTWYTNWSTIEQMAKRIEEKAQLIQLDVKSTLEFKPSEKACQWCPAKGFCEARRQSLTSDIEALAVIEDKPPALPEPGAMSAEQISALLTHKGEIVSWLGDVEEYALAAMQDGRRTFPGFKLVMSRGGNRYWSDPERVALLLHKDTILKVEEIWESKLISPGAAEKLLGKGKFSVELTNLIAKPPGKPVIAPLEDKREAIVDAAMSEIEDISAMQ